MGSLIVFSALAIASLALFTSVAAQPLELIGVNSISLNKGAYQPGDVATLTVVVSTRNQTLTSVSVTAYCQKPTRCPIAGQLLPGTHFFTNDTQVVVVGPTQIAAWNASTYTVQMIIGRVSNGVYNVTVRAYGETASAETSGVTKLAYVLLRVTGSSITSSSSSTKSNSAASSTLAPDGVVGFFGGYSTVLVGIALMLGIVGIIGWRRFGSHKRQNPER